MVAVPGFEIMLCHSNVDFVGLAGIRTPRPELSYSYSLLFSKLNCLFLYLIVYF